MDPSNSILEEPSSSTPSEESRPAKRPRQPAALRPGQLAHGIVLAMHCVTSDADPQVENFWSKLSAELADRDFSLILLSTAPVMDPALQVINIPHDPTTFAQRFAFDPVANSIVHDDDIADTAAWYRCTEDTAMRNLRVAHAFINDLLETLRPAAILGWQDQILMTRILREHARRRGIPYWGGERGPVRNTLLFDLAGPQVLGQLYADLSSSRQRHNYDPSPELMASLRQRTTEAVNLDRYPASPRIEPPALRRKLDIPDGQRIAVLFMHCCEPGLTTAHASAQPAMLDAVPSVLQQRLDALAPALLQRGYWLLVQEHPLTIAANRCMRLPMSPMVLSVRENISSLLDAADLSLYTFASLQFDAIFLDKPLGLLARSALYSDGVPPFMGDYESADEFLDAVLDQEAWPERFKTARSHIAYLYEHLLLDIESAAVAISAKEWANHLAQFKRPVGSEFPERVERFLADWG